MTRAIYCVLYTYNSRASRSSILYPAERLLLYFLTVFTAARSRIRARITLIHADLGGQRPVFFAGPSRLARPIVPQKQPRRRPRVLLINQQEMAARAEK